MANLNQVGGPGDDTLVGGSGDDTFDGGAGLDTVVFTGDRADYAVSTDPFSGVTTVQDLRSGSPDGLDSLINVERLKFADQTANAHPGFFDLASLDGNNGFAVTDPETHNTFPTAASAGDFNHDGLADIIIGDSFGGSSSVVFGRASGAPTNLDVSALDGTNGFRINSSGFAVASAGDINGDGFTDLAIGRPGGAAHGQVTGEADVIFGGALPAPALFDLSSLDGSNGFRVNGESAASFAGWSVSAGDFNGDGISDLFTSAQFAPSGGPYSTGAVYVVYGTTAGIPANFELSSLAGVNGLKVAGLDQGVTTVSSAGDINGDGFDDLVIGSPYMRAYGYAAGAAYVVFGHPSGPGPVTDVSTLDGTNGFKLSGAPGLYAEVGFSVASAGDVNGDGFADIIIGAPGAGGGDYAGGASYVVFGKASGFPAAVDLASLDGTNGFRMGGGVEETVGRSVASAGDVNGDGFDDVIVSGLRGYQGGSVYLVYGKASGFSADLYLPGMDGTDGFKIVGAPDQIAAVASAGDMNGDGLDDMVLAGEVGAGSNYGAGTTYVVYGQLPDTAVTRTGTNASQKLVGGDFSDQLSGRGGDDRLYGHGGDDSLDGGAGNDTAIYYGDRAQYLVTTDGAGVTTVQDLRSGSPDGTDTLTNIEHLRFADQTIATPTQPANASPAPVIDSLTTAYAHPVSVSTATLLANDTDPNGDSLSLTAVGGAQHGTVSLAGGVVTFTPYVGYVGSAGFSYTVDDGHGGTATGQVNVTVTGTSPAYDYRAASTAAETIDFTGDGAAHSVLTGSGDTTVLTGSGGGSVRLGAGNDVVIGGTGKDTITFGPGLGTATGGAGPDVFVFVKGQIADPSAHAGAFDTITDFSGAGSAYAVGRDFIYLKGFANTATITYEHDLAGDSTAHLYRVDDGAYHAEFVLDYAGQGVALSHNQFGFL